MHEGSACGAQRGMTAAPPASITHATKCRWLRLNGLHLLLHLLLVHHLLILLCGSLQFHLWRN